MPSNGSEDSSDDVWVQALREVYENAPQDQKWLQEFYQKDVCERESMKMQWLEKIFFLLPELYYKSLPLEVDDKELETVLLDRINSLINVTGLIQ